MVVGRDDAAARGLGDEPDGRVEHDVGAHAGNQAVSDGVAKGHDGDGDEGRDGVAQVGPVDLDDGADHHGADQDEHAARGPGRDGGEDGREEDGDEEAEPRRHGRQARLAALADARAGLDEGGHGGRAEEGADGDGDGVDHVSMQESELSISQERDWTEQEGGGEHG